MHPNSFKRRAHSPEFKAKILAECRRPGASVTAVAIGHGLNPNVVRKWLAGQGLKRAGLARPAVVARAGPALQFVPVALSPTGHDKRPRADAAQGDIRIEIERGALQVKLRCPASAGPTYAAVLRALADAVAAG
jgi:transposase